MKINHDEEQMNALRYFYHKAIMPKCKYISFMKSNAVSRLKETMIKEEIIDINSRIMPLEDDYSWQCLFFPLVEQ